MPRTDVVHQLGYDDPTFWRTRRWQESGRCSALSSRSSRYRKKPEDVVLKLRQVEVLQGQGKSVQEAVRQIGVTDQTYSRWRKEYGGMNRDQLKQLKM